MPNILDTLPKKVIDQENSFTLAEMRRSSGMAQHALERLREEKLGAGEWEEVWKECNGKLVKSYRLKP